MTAWPQPVGVWRAGAAPGVIATGVVWPSGRTTLRACVEVPGGLAGQVATWDHICDVQATCDADPAMTLRVADPLHAPDEDLGVRLLALVHTVPHDCVWWWGVQWTDCAHAVTCRADAHPRAAAAAVTSWPGGADQARCDLSADVLGTLDLAWLPDHAVRVAAAVRRQPHRRRWPLG